MILQPNPNPNFPDDVSLHVSSNGWSKGCWATVVVGCGGEWRNAYSPKWGMKIRPEYVAWRIARRVVGRDKPFPEVRKARDLVLSSGLAHKAIVELNVYLERVKDVAKSVFDEIGAVGVSAEVQVAPTIPTNCVNVDVAFSSAVFVTVRVKSDHNRWTFDLKEKMRPSTKEISNVFLTGHWPEATGQPWLVPPPVKKALDQAETRLASRIVDLVNRTLAEARLPGSPVMTELNRRVHDNRILASKFDMRRVVKAARGNGLSDNEISAIWKELIVEDIHEC